MDLTPIKVMPLGEIGEDRLEANDVLYAAIDEAIGRKPRGHDFVSDTSSSTLRYRHFAIDRRHRVRRSHAL